MSQPIPPPSSSQHTSPPRPPPSERAAATITGMATAPTTTPPLPPPRETTIIISPVGDVLLRLLTPTHTLHYRASASVLITTSKVFSAMLSPTSPFSEAQRFNLSPSTTSSSSSAEPFVLSLHDDDPVALCILLKALHNHPSVPLSLAFKQLVKMAIVVDKYDCSHATRMYSDKWMKSWTSRADRPGFEEWLFVAWVWGVEEIFEKLFARAIVDVCVQRVEGGMDRVPVFRRGKGGGSGFGEFLPETVLKAILNHRAHLLTHIKLVFTALFNRYQPPSSSQASTLQCAFSSPDPRCDALIFSSVYRKLSEINLLPWNSIEDLDGFTVTELVDWVLAATAPPSSSSSPSASVKRVRMLFLEKHAKACDPLEKLAAQVRAAMSAGIGGAGGTGCDVWGFRARESVYSWEDVSTEVGASS